MELAQYNAWANARLFADAATLPEEALEEDVGVYFTSLFATLEHVLKVDRAWQYLLDGGAVADLAPARPMADFAALRAARRTEDEQLVRWLSAVNAAWLDAPFTFQSALPMWQGLTWRGTRASTLTHLFNHQTHHRGQAHAALTRLGIVEPQSLDLLVKFMLGE